MTNQTSGADNLTRKNIIETTLTDSCFNPFHADNVISLWYPMYKNSYCFVFSENRNSTNIQYAELISLLQTHVISNFSRNPAASCATKTVCHVDGRHALLQFKSTAEFATLLDGLWGSLENAEEFRAQFEHMLSDTILIDLYYASAIVRLPVRLSLNLDLVCGESGYIHSCGRLIYFSQTRTANQRRLEKNIHDFINDHSIPNQQYALTPFSVEHFPAKEHAGHLRGGPEGLKIRLRKFYFQETHIIDLLAELKASVQLGELGDRLRIVGLEDKVDASGEDKESRIWLFVDKSLVEGARQYGKGRYFVVYAQEFSNKNPFIMFSEEKPGWIAPVTLPHSLAAAMLNITRPWPTKRDSDSLVTIMDPFGGTGTTLLEALKLNNDAANINFITSDLTPISEIVVRDNLKFFSLTAAELSDLQQYLIKVFEGAVGFDARSGTPYFEAYELCSSIVDKYAADSNDMLALRRLLSHDFDHGTFLSRFKRKCRSAKQNGKTLIDSECDFVKRVMFYIIWRGYLSNLYNIKTKKDVKVIVQKAIEDIFGTRVHGEEKGFERLSELILLRKNEEDLVRSSPIAITEGEWSKVCAVSRTAVVQSSNTRTWRIIVGDAVNNLQKYKGKIDIIITDPPYGFNTDQSRVTLADLYRRMVPAMIDALRDNGQIVLCLPSTAWNGQKIPAFAMPESVVNSIFASVARTYPRKEIVRAAYTRPAPRDLLEAPYYWEAETSLTRTILHMRVRSV